MTEVLNQLKDAIVNEKPIEILPIGSDIKSGKELKINETINYSLNEITNFITTDNKKHDLRSIYQVYLHYLKKTSTTEYIEDCEKLKIDVISFLERTDLISWLTGSSSECEFIKEGSGNDASNDGSLKSANVDSNSKTSSKTKPLSDVTTTTTTTADTNTEESSTNTGNKKRKDPFLREIESNERNLINHNKALRGSKLIDFSNVAKECQNRIIVPIKQSENSSSSSKNGSLPSSSSRSTVPSSSSSTATSTASKGKSTESSTNNNSNNNKTKNKDPIIILSPSASAILNMGNVKSFLEDGKFINNNDTYGNGNMLQIQRKSRLLNKPVKFLVVNNVEKFFTKSEYWDRVVCVFTTGQEWQFKNYKYREPKSLFQRYKGFYVQYKGDSIPKSVQSWNVQVVELERNQRFKDRQTAELLWESLEKFMISRGFK